MPKTIKELRDEKIIKLVDRYKENGTITDAYSRASVETGVSIPTVIKIYKSNQNQE